jgi:hypothetical protein
MHIIVCIMWAINLIINVQYHFTCNWVAATFLIYVVTGWNADSVNSCIQNLGQCFSLNLGNILGKTWSLPNKSKIIRNLGISYVCISKFAPRLWLQIVLSHFVSSKAVFCLWPAGGNLSGFHATVWYLTIYPFQLRRKRPTQVILENHGCKFTHSWKTAVKPTCVCVCVYLHQ